MNKQKNFLRETHKHSPSLLFGCPRPQSFIPRPGRKQDGRRSTDDWRCLLKESQLLYPVTVHYTMDVSDGLVNLSRHNSKITLRPTNLGSYRPDPRVTNDVSFSSLRVLSTEVEVFINPSGASSPPTLRRHPKHDPSVLVLLSKIVHTTSRSDSVCCS